MDPYIKQTIIKGIFETLQMTFFASLFSYAAGLPLGVILYTTAKGHLFESSFMARVEDFYDLDRKCPFCGTKQPNKGVKVEFDWNGR